MGVNVSYALEEHMPLGTAGCVKNICDKLNDTFAILAL